MSVHVRQKRHARSPDVLLLMKIISGLVDKDGFDVTDDLSEPTMGEKLASLNLEGNDKASSYDNVDFSPPAKPPSADSVYILLEQALRADDRALLIDCLYRQDEKSNMMHHYTAGNYNSLSLLNPSDVLKFLQSLVSIIQLRGSVLACALPWLRRILLQHAGSIMSQESSLDVLNSLYQVREGFKKKLINRYGESLNKKYGLLACSLPVYLYHGKGS
ncbi:hypothetical protein Pfo_021245 [Paulownia fortunei]|nr:hypothetical protein Pfo_021245 [Paulownia fortunei]